MRKKKLLLCFFWAIAVVCSLLSCGKDRWPEYYPYTGHALWMDSLMREDYLWYADMPAFDDLNFFLEPQNFLEEVRSPRDEGFSKVDSLQQTLQTIYGFEYSLSKVPDNDTAFYAQVTYVIPQSPADEAGLKRGEWIMRLDTAYITRQHESALQRGESRQLSIGHYVVQTDDEGNETGFVQQVRTATMPAARQVADAVVPAYSIPADYVGYLAYNSFDPSADEQLRELSRYYREHNVENMVVDLRYNAGGHLSCVQLLAAMMVPADKLGATLASLSYNDKHADRNHDLTIDVQTLQGGVNLNLSQVVFLTSSATAGAAETLINALRPYLTVTTVGQATKGEYVATESYVNQAFGIRFQPAVCEVRNADAQPVDAAGIAPDHRVSELADPLTVLPLGDAHEAMLAVALAAIEGSVPPQTLLRQPLQADQPVVAVRHVASPAKSGQRLD